MPRPPHLNLPHIPQHVVQRGVTHQDCFFESRDYRTFIDLLAKACDGHVCKLYAFVLMKSHFHLLLTPNDSSSVSFRRRDGRSRAVRHTRRAQVGAANWVGYIQRNG